jgi:hypothetical protein
LPACCGTLWWQQVGGMAFLCQKISSNKHVRWSCLPLFPCDKKAIPPLAVNRLG